MVGIVDGGAVVENGSVILSLPLLQEITGNQGKINIIDLRVTSGTSKAAIFIMPDGVWCGRVQRGRGGGLARMHRLCHTIVTCTFETVSASRGA